MGYIKRDELIKFIDEKGVKLGLTTANICKFKEIVMEIPSCDVSQKKVGTWSKSEQIDEQYGYLYKCSCCQTLNWYANYCSFCGSENEKKK